MDKVRFVFYHHIGRCLLVLRRPHTRDYRTRRDRTERRTQAYAAQLPALKDAYMAWMLGLGEDRLAKTYTLPPDLLPLSSNQEFTRVFLPKAPARPQFIIWRAMPSLPLHSSGKD